jgi:DNA-binding LacI/PurR family transcriptional regulator
MSPVRAAMDGTLASVHTEGRADRPLLGIREPLALTRSRKKQPKPPRAGLTMADLAELAGVSKITVSRALADSALVSARTRERIQKLAREHGYKLNVNARNLRLRRSHTVAVIVEMQPSSDRTMWDPYPLTLLGGISQELTSSGYSVLLTTRDGAASAAVRGADGVILLGQGERQDAVRLFDKLGLPMVVWGAQSASDSHVVVGSNNRQGGATVAERFVSIGNPDHPEIAERLHGFVDELARHDIKPLLMRRDEFTLASGVDAVHSLARRKVRFDSIFACSDLLAMGAIRALVELGHQVPSDVSVVGYDDTPLGASFLPPLSSVRQNWQEGGMLLARKVLALVDGKPAYSEMLSTTLVLRAT